MKNLKSILLTTLVILTSCSGGKSKDVKNINENSESSILPPYSINIEKIISTVESENLSKITDNITYIPLETSPDYFLRRVHEYLFFNNTLLVHDFSNLYQFSKQGKFLKKISAKGTGPSDYTYVNAIIKNNKSTLFYLFTSGKINRYDKDVNYLKSSPKSDYMYFGITTPWDTYLMYLGANFKVIGDTTTIYSFAEMDILGNIVRQIPNPSPVEATYHGLIFNFIPLYKYKESVRFMDYGNDTLFTFTEKGDKMPYAICNLGSMKREVNTSGFNEQKMEALSSKLLVDRICEDDQFIYITLQWGVSNKHQYILFNKKTGSLSNLGNQGFVNDIDGGIPFFPRFIEEDGTKVMWMQAEDFIETMKSTDKQNPQNADDKKFFKTKEFISNLNADDNPIFITVK